MAEQAAAEPKAEEVAKEEPKAEEAPKEAEAEQPKEEPKAEENADKPADKNDDDNKESEAKEDNNKPEESEKPCVDFSGSWTLKSSSKSIDEYYKSEGWSYMMRKFAPMIAMKQIIKQVINNDTK